MTNQLEKIKEDWFKLGYHDPDVPGEYEKFKKEWNAFDKGFRFAKMDGWLFIEKVYSQACKENWRIGAKYGKMKQASEMKELKQIRKSIGEVYKQWALTHTATWETDNLVHDLQGNPKKPLVLAKNK